MDHCQQFCAVWSSLLATVFPVPRKTKLNLSVYSSNLVRVPVDLFYCVRNCEILEGKKTALCNYTKESIINTELNGPDENYLPKTLCNILSSLNTTS